MLKKWIISIFVFVCLYAIAGTPAVYAASAEGVITADRVNMRARPNTDSDKLALLDKDTKVTVIGSRGEWFNIKYDGKEGWVQDDFMIKRDGSSSSSSSSEKKKSSSSSALSEGDKSDEVKKLQTALKYLGYMSGSADGAFGKVTEKAVKLYQQTNKLDVDGIAGKNTLGKIYAEKEKIENVIALAKEMCGTPYVYAASSPSSGFDCSGLTMYCFGKYGVSLEHSSAAQAEAGYAVPKSQMRPGDLVCFYSPVSHVGLYIGSGKYIHAPQEGENVKIATLNTSKVTHVRRVIGRLPSTED